MAFLPVVANAKGEAALAFLGGAFGTGTGIYYGTRAHELEDWKQPSTDSTVKLSHQCGMSSEWRLLGNNAYNMLFLVLKNDQGTTIHADVANLRMKFDTGMERLAVFRAPPQPVPMRPQEAFSFYPLFPSKDDFKSASRIDFELPIESEGKICTVHTAIVRPPGVPRVNLTSSSVTSFEVSLGVGGSLVRSRDIDALGEAEPNLDLTLYGFPTLHHGIYLGLLIQPIKGDRTYLSSLTGGTDNDPHLSTTAITTGYTFRSWFPDKRIQFSTDFGLGVKSYHYNRSNGGNSDETAEDFAAQLKLSLSYRLNRTRVREGRWRGDYYFGTSAYDIYVPNGTIGAFPSSGHDAGVLFFFKFGG